MIVQEIYLKDWDWSVTVYYAVTTYYTDEILDELEFSECSLSELIKAEDMLRHLDFNVGLTYSNYKKRHSVVVIGLTTCPEEFQNTFDHEKGHLAMHVCKYLDIDPFSEEYQYVTGEIGLQMFKVAKKFLCEHCRSKLLNKD